MRWRLLLLGGVVLAVAAGLVWAMAAGLQPEVSQEATDGPWEVRGGFRRESVSLETVCSAHQAALYWVSIPGNGAGAYLASPTFAAPPVVEVLVTGNLDGRATEAWLERPSSKERLPIRAAAGELWRPVTLALPPRWLGKPIRLVAQGRVDTPGRRFGISNPISYNRDAVLASQLRMLRVFPEQLVGFVLFVAPGLALALACWRRLGLRPCYLAVLAVVCSCLLGYAVFWAYFFSPSVGCRVGPGLALLGVVALLLFLTSAPVRQLLRSPDVLAPLVLWLVTGLFYTGVLFAVDLDLPNANQARARFTGEFLPPDDALPLLLAHRLYAGADPRHLLGDWHSSDRPPLQAGLVLMQAPLVSAFREHVTFYYPPLGCVVQCSWIPAVWALLCILTSSGPRIAVTMLCLVSSGFTLVNSVYVWPKLLAAALALFPFALLLERLLRQQRPTAKDMVLVGAGVALASLAHGGAGLFSVCLLPLVFRPRSFPGLPRLLAGALPLLALLLPWLAYQRYYDPPGNRLAKIHLAGDLSVDDCSLPQALWDGYRGAGLTGAVRNKAENVKALFAENDAVLFGGTGPWEGAADDPLGAWRRRQFHQLFLALGLLNAGWIVPALSLVRRRALPAAERWVLGVSLAGLALWVLVLFGPGATVIHHGPYALFLLLFLLLAFWVAGLPPWLSGPLVALHLAGFFAVQVCTSPANAFGLPNGPLIACTAGCAVAVGWTALWMGRKRYRDGNFAAAEVGIA